MPLRMGGQLGVAHLFQGALLHVRLGWLWIGSQPGSCGQMGTHPPNTSKQSKSPEGRLTCGGSKKAEHENRITFSLGRLPLTLQTTHPSHQGFPDKRWLENGCSKAGGLKKKQNGTSEHLKGSLWDSRSDRIAWAPSGRRSCPTRRLPSPTCREAKRSRRAAHLAVRRSDA